MDRFIPLSVPNFEGNEKEYLNDAFDQGWVSTAGEYVNRLEKDLASYLQVEDVAVCQSGTAGIHLALIDAGVGADDIVIVPTLTFIAAVNPVKYQGAEPIFMDCDDSLCMDASKLDIFCDKECEFDGARLIHRASNKHVKAVIVVHVFGNMTDMEAIMNVANKYNLVVIEDATEALGTYYTDGKYKGKYAGTIGDYGVFSFNGNKIITTGGGGAVTSNKKDSVTHMRHISTQAKEDPLFYKHDEVGYNYRMTNVQAAIGVGQLEMLDEFIVRKQKNYNLYQELFAEFELANILEFRVDTYSNKWFYSILIEMDKVNGNIRDIIEKLSERGVQTRAIWELIHEQRPYTQCINYEIDKAKYYSERIINIPCSTNLTEDDIRFVAQQIEHVLRALHCDVEDLVEKI